MDTDQIMMSDFISASIDVWNYVFAPIGLNPCPAEPGYALSFANSVDPDLKKPTDLDLHCLPFSI